MPIFQAPKVLNLGLWVRSLSPKLIRCSCLIRILSSSVVRSQFNFWTLTQESQMKSLVSRNPSAKTGSPSLVVKILLWTNKSKINCSFSSERRVQTRIPMTHLRFIRESWWKTCHFSRRLRWITTSKMTIPQSSFSPNKIKFSKWTSKPKTSKLSTSLTRHLDVSRKSLDQTLIKISLSSLLVKMVSGSTLRRGKKLIWMKSMR